MGTPELALFGRDLFGDIVKPKPSGPVAEKFLFAPFSVLSARDGTWQKRKSAWLRMGIQSEESRTMNGDGKRLLLKTSSGTDFYIQKRKVERSLGCALTTSEFKEKYYKEDRAADQGASIFDPVLCELAYRWWCPAGGMIVDPFAGGSVRGIIAGALSFHYWGCDLRAEQIAANETQADTIQPDIRPTWVSGDSLETLASAPEADFLFSCPPYGDLEKYCDDPRDLSNMKWYAFLTAYKRIIAEACERLKQNRFACFVVGDFRDPHGFYRDFVSETIRGFKETGLELYNEAILVTSVGSASMRVTRQFAAGRKLCKTHQNVLVFCKGDPRKAARAINGKNT